MRRVIVKITPSGSGLVRTAQTAALGIAAALLALITLAISIAVIAVLAIGMAGAIIVALLAAGPMLLAERIEAWRRRGGKERGE